MIQPRAHAPGWTEGTYPLCSRCVHAACYDCGPCQERMDLIFKRQDERWRHTSQRTRHDRGCSPRGVAGGTTLLGVGPGFAKRVSAPIRGLARYARVCRRSTILQSLRSSLVARSAIQWPFRFGSAIAKCYSPGGQRERPIAVRRQQERVAGDAEPLLPETGCARRQPPHSQDHEPAGARLPRRSPCPAHPGRCSAGWRGTT